jgi:cyclophilin family peptidyl-prolyl cis-trans isomerase
MRLFVGLIALVATLITMPADARKKQPAPLAKSTPIVAVASQSDPENLLYLDLDTGGRVTIWLRPDVAPKMVERVKLLTRQHFYDGLPFHRVIEGFMAQGGDPNGDGTGGSKLPNVPAEFNALPHVRGAVSAARAEDNDSANSQFFIVFQPTLKLDRKYTVFGRVIDGMQYVDAITRGEPPANPSHILHMYIAADHPGAYVPAPPRVVAAPVTLPPAPAPAAAPIVAKPQLAKPAPAKAAPKTSAKKPVAKTAPATR